MPYYEESPFGAAADVFGGIAAGRQQTLQDQMERQRLASEIAAQQAQIASSQQEQQYRAIQISDAQRQANIDVASQKFEKNLKYPKNWSNMNPDQQVAYLQVRQDHARAVGDTGLAQDTQKQIDQLYGLTKAGMMAQMRAQALALQQQLGYARIAASESNNAATNATNLQRSDISANASIGNNIRTQQGADTRSAFSAINATNKANDSWLHQQIGNMKAENDRRVGKVTKDADGNPIAMVPPNANMNLFVQGLQARIKQVQADPSKANAIMAEIMAKKGLTDSQKTLAVEAIQRYADAASSARSIRKYIVNPPGGSNDNSDPQSPWP